MNTLSGIIVVAIVAMIVLFVWDVANPKTETLHGRVMDIVSRPCKRTGIIALYDITTKTVQRIEMPSKEIPFRYMGERVIITLELGRITGSNYSPSCNQVYHEQD